MSVQYTVNEKECAFGNLAVAHKCQLPCSHNTTNCCVVTHNTFSTTQFYLMQSIVSFIIYQLSMLFLLFHRARSPVVETESFAIGSNTQKSYKEKKIQKFIISSMYCILLDRRFLVML